MKTKKIKKFVIDRKKWGRGGGEKSVSLLLNEENGKMCCLGFYSLGCGLKENQIAAQCLVTDLNYQYPDQMDWLGEEHDDGEGTNEDTLVKINDSKGIRDRAKKIAAEFAKQGIEVTFIN